MGTFWTVVITLAVAGYFIGAVWMWSTLDYVDGGRLWMAILWPLVLISMMFGNVQ